MHKYIRAVGFSGLRTITDQNKVLATVLENPTYKQEITIGANTNFVQYSRSFGDGIGISVIGEVDDKNNFSFGYAFPYCHGKHITKELEIGIERHFDKEAYSGTCDNYNLNMTLIFSVQNVVDYVRSNWINEYYRMPKKVRYGALSVDGRILFGVNLENATFLDEKQPISVSDRRKLIAKAKEGDMDALENLTLDDMDTYSLINKRIKEEDLFSVVQTSFMPYGIDYEEYAILGDIKEVSQITNEITDEIVYNLTVLCNDVMLNVAINSQDLEGEPLVGRRFRGIILLQGLVDFNEGTRS